MKYKVPAIAHHDKSGDISRTGRRTAKRSSVWTKRVRGAVKEHYGIISLIMTHLNKTADISDTVQDTKLRYYVYKACEKLDWICVLKSVLRPIVF